MGMVWARRGSALSSKNSESAHDATRALPDFGQNPSSIVRGLRRIHPQF